MNAARHLLILGALGLGTLGASSGCGLGDIASTENGQPSPLEDGEGEGPDGEIPHALNPAGAQSLCIPPACQKVPLPASTHATRLTKIQCEHTMKDLLRLTAEPGLSSTFPVDPSVSADHFGTEAGDIVVTTSHGKAFQKAAEDLATLVVDDPIARARILPAGAASGTVAARITAFVTDFLPRAYRRPVTPGEIAKAVALGDAAVQTDTTSDPFLIRMKWILVSLLQSPQVLYRFDLGDVNVKYARVRLDPYEIAAKLSYALWDTMPDDQLTEYARTGKLSTKAGVAEVAKEMIASPKANQTIATFHDQLMFVWDYEQAKRNPAAFPRYYDEFQAEAMEDIRRTVKDLVIDNPKGTVKDLYSSTTAYVTAKLAPVYDIDPSTVPALVTSPTQFTKVNMDPKKRIGILMHPGWLAYEAAPKDPSIIRRGAYLARHLLCVPLGTPPPAAAGVSVDKSTQPTNRGRVTDVTKTCGDGCHGGPTGIINPLGFSLEHFDSLGAYRDKDYGNPIDSTGSITALGSFDGGVALFEKAATDPNTHACYAAHWIAFLNGTRHVDATPKWLTPVVYHSLNGASVRDIIASLVQTDAFLTVSR